MKPSIQVEVIIVTYNSAEIISGCIDSLYSKTKNFAFGITVVDNNSHDSTIDIIESNYPGVRLIKNKENVGFGRANNIAIKQSNAEYVFLLNPDTLLLNNAIEILTEFLNNHQEVALCGSNLFDVTMKPQSCYGHFPSIKNVFCEQLFKNIFPNYFKKHHSLITDNYSTIPIVVDYVSGSNMFIRKRVLDEVGYFDEDFFLYYEETELTFRIDKHGYKVFLVPSAQLIHIGGTSLNMNEYKKYPIFKKSEKLFFEKAYGQFYWVIVYSLYYISYYCKWKITNNVKFLYFLDALKKA